MDKQDFGALLRKALEAAAANAEIQLGYTLSRNFQIRLFAPGHSQGTVLDVATALDELYLGADRFYRVIDVAIMGVSTDATTVFVRVSGHQPGSFAATYNYDAGLGPFKQLGVMQPLSVSDRQINTPISASVPRSLRQVQVRKHIARLISVRGRTDVILTGWDLRGADLSSLDLRRADLRGAKLQNADLTCANLAEADLGGAELQGASLRGANLQEANLAGADVRGADVREAVLRGAVLVGANLRDAKFDGSDLDGADVREVKGLETDGES